MPTKKPYEIAVDAFEDADKAYRELEDSITSGDALIEILHRHRARQEDAIKAEWQTLWSQLREKLDDRNTKYVEAANEMRRAVAQDVSQGAKWRGPDGKSDRLSYGKLEVNTRTKRFFNGDELLKLVERHNILPEVEQLTYLDEKTGRREPIVQSVIVVEYKHMLQWLRDHDNGTKDNPSIYRKILDGAYDEKEETPMVQGDKRIAFLGQKVDK